MEYLPIEKPKRRERVLLSHAHKAKPRTPSSKKLNEIGADKCSNRKGTKFVGVRQRPSGKWVAEIKDTTQKIRMWLGTFETAEEAARAYDEAALLLRGSSTRTNFADANQYRAANSPISTKIRNLLDHKISLKRNSPRTNSYSLGNGNVSIATAPAFKVNQSNSSSSVSTTTSTVIDKSLDSTTDQDTSLFAAKNEEHNNNVMSSSSDEGYRPDLSSCIVEQERATTLGVSHRFSCSSWPFATALEEQVPAIATSIEQRLLSWDDFKAADKTEFAPIIDETRIPASMYEVNGFLGNGCETGNHVDTLWDFSKLYCPPCTFFFN